LIVDYCAAARIFESPESAHFLSVCLGVKEGPWSPSERSGRSSNGTSAYDEFGKEVIN